MTRSLEDPDRSKDVDLEIEVRPLDRHPYVCLRSQMEADLRARSERFLYGGGISNVSLDEAGAFVQPLAAARGEVVEDRDLVPAGDERVDEM